MNLSAIIFMVLTMLAAVLLSVRIFDGNPERLEPERDADGLEKPLLRFHKPAGLSRADLLPLLAVTLLGALLGFLNLGDTRAVTSWHTFARAGESAELILPEGGEPGAISWFAGGTVGTWRLEWTSDGESWSQETLQQDYTDVLKWHSFTPEGSFGRVTRLRITALRGDMTLGEIALWDAAGGQLPFLCEAAELCDEQALARREEDWRNSSYFDEIYHARTAWEHLTDRNPYEITHPPLGKEIIGLGIRLFGMTPFGWRFSGVLFGVLMLPVLYLFLKLMLGSILVSACTTAVFALDFMHFAQTRIATIDTYGVFFTLLMYFFFYLYYTQPWDAPLRRTLLPLGLSGLCFALGAVSKWTCIFGGGGLAVLWCLRQGERLRRRGFREELWSYFLPTVAWSCVFYLGFPVLAYYLCYAPYARAAGVSMASTDYLKLILDNIRYMYSYHSGLEATHPYESTWWMWMLDIRPILYYLHYFDDAYAVKSAFGACGNPLFWWTGLGAMACMAVKGIRGDRMAWFILAGYLSCLLPWVTVERCAFIYHYFPATVFLALVLVLFSLAISVGDARVPFILSVTRQGIIFIIAITVLSALLGYYGVITAQPAADILTAFLALFLFRRRLRARLY